MNVGGERHLWMNKSDGTWCCNCGAERHKIATPLRVLTVYRVPSPGGGFTGWDHERPSHVVLMTEMGKKEGA